MKQNVLRNEKGVALVIALLMLLVLTIAGIGAMNSTSFENMISGNDRTATAAFYAAEAGIDLQMNQIPNQLPNLTPIDSKGIGTDAVCWSGHPQDKSFPPVLVNLGSYFLQGGSSWGTDLYQANATGKSFSSVKEIEVQFTYGPYWIGTGYN